MASSKDINDISGRYDAFQDQRDHSKISSYTGHALELIIHICY